MKKIIISLSLFALLAACQESLEEKAAREARDVTRKNCPYPIDDYLILDSFTFDRATHTFGYHYTPQPGKEQLLVFPAEQTRQVLAARVKNETSLKAFKDEGYSFRYVYHSSVKADSLLFATTIQKEDYQ